MYVLWVTWLQYKLATDTFDTDKNECDRIVPKEKWNFDQKSRFGKLNDNVSSGVMAAYERRRIMGLTRRSDNRQLEIIINGRWC